MEKFKYLNKANILKLPKTSGVYAFLNKGQLLYIGKAINIKERVKNHLNQPNYRDNLFIDQTTRIGYINTDSEIEALILEANLIKQHQPKYNVMWKDDKNYFYVGVTQEDFPRIFITHQPQKEIKGPKYVLKENRLTKIPSNLKVFYVGPFVDGRALKKTLDSLRKAFPFRSLRIIPNRPCLWHQLGRCPGPCALNSPLAEQIPGAAFKIKKESKKNAKNLILVLQAKRARTLNALKKEMGVMSKGQKFEEAAKARNQIRDFEMILSHAKVLETSTTDSQQTLNRILEIKKDINRIEAYDISNIQGKEAVGSMVVFIQGKPAKEFYRKFKIKKQGKPDDISMLKEVLQRRLKHEEWPFPDLILIDGGKAQLNIAQKTVKNKIPTAAIAKKENKLYSDKKKDPLFLKSLPRDVFDLILQLRDEAHRFAIAYHKKLRRKKILGY
ncbi:MAG: GIY-YIG nuclease family protein [Candidatus Nealsonbacteria bacterium]